VIEGEDRLLVGIDDVDHHAEVFGELRVAGDDELAR
jgi:hypothetical protein